MFEERVVFGQRAVLLSEGAGRLPERVLRPGPGMTVAQRADRATEPVSAAVVARVTRVATAWGVAPLDQDAVDIPAAARLCPADRRVVAYAEAILNLSAWRYRVEHSEPGHALARLLEARPDTLAPAPGTGTVVEGDIGTICGAAPAETTWPGAVLTSIVARERLISHLRAEQYRDLAVLSAGYPGIHQFLATEIALALHVTETEAASMLGVAEALRDRLPDTLERLSTGEIDEAKATAMVNATLSTTAEVAHAVEQKILPHAATATPTTVRRRAGRAVIALDPDGAADRHRRACAERFVSRRAESDGMARLSVFAPAQNVAVMWEAITACADTLKRPGDTRSLANRRVDALTMVCHDILDGGGWKNMRLTSTGAARPRIMVTVPYTVLLGHRAPCELSGHGPIPTEQALALIGSGDLYRMVCDPLSGMMLDYGRTRYRPPPHLAEFVRARDGECPMPCCHHPAARGHIDHVISARPDPSTGLPTHGTTSADNLAAPCGHHHLAKDAGRGFILRRDPRTGVYTWTTPLGRAYTWTPEPHWHPDTDALPESNAGGNVGGDRADGDWADEDWADGFRPRTSGISPSDIRDPTTESPPPGRAGTWSDTRSALDHDPPPF